MRSEGLAILCAAEFVYAIVVGILLIINQIQKIPSSIIAILVVVSTIIMVLILVNKEKADNINKYVVLSAMILPYAVNVLLMLAKYHF